MRPIVSANTSFTARTEEDYKMLTKKVIIKGRLQKNTPTIMEIYISRGVVSGWVIFHMFSLLS